VVDIRLECGDLHCKRCVFAGLAEVGRFGCGPPCVEQQGRKIFGALSYRTYAEAFMVVIAIRDRNQLKRTHHIRDKGRVALEHDRTAAPQHASPMRGCSIS